MQKIQNTVCFSLSPVLLFILWEWEDIYRKIGMEKMCVRGKESSSPVLEVLFGVEYKKKNDKKNKDRVQRKGREGKGRRGGIR